MDTHQVLRGNYETPELLSFVKGVMAEEDESLRYVLRRSAENGLPPIQIGPLEGKILHFLVKACGAKKAVEIGTLAGYSGIWIARALPEDGVLTTLELDPKHVRVASECFQKAGLGRKVKILEGPALESLKTIEPQGPFDFCFIDADKASYPEYLRWAVKNLRPGGIAVGDNAYYFGKAHLEPESIPDPDEARGAVSMREFLGLLADGKSFSSCAMIPTGEGMAAGIKA